MIYLGIDPGISGAIAALDDSGAVKLCTALPVRKFGTSVLVDAEELCSMLHGLGLPHVPPADCWYSALIERAQAFPGQGRSSAFNYGAAFGSVVTALAWARLDFVSPARWKRGIGLSADKSAALDRARMLFPTVKLDRKCDHHRAEALLIAEYHRRREIGVSRAMAEVLNEKHRDGTILRGLTRNPLRAWRQDENR